ncbi:MAG: hypothetical protein GY841_04220 [FCB group bacterium]|nr:hypothetical protein [FCB group bacterium]
MKIFIALLTVAFLIGCGSGDKSETEQTSPAETPALEISDGFTPGESIMPLAEGNLWNYQISAYDTVALGMVPTSVDSFKVLGDTVLGEETWYFVVGLGPNRGTVRNRDDGFWFIRPGEEPFLFAKYPAVPGEEYRNQISGTDVYNRVEETSVEITVPAGKFVCFKYRQIVGAKRMTTDYYFSPGNGLVKTDIHSPSGGYMIFTAELMDKNF